MIRTVPELLEIAQRRTQLQVIGWGEITDWSSLFCLDAEFAAYRRGVRQTASKQNREDQSLFLKLAASRGWRLNSRLRQRSEKVLIIDRLVQITRTRFARPIGFVESRTNDDGDIAGDGVGLQGAKYLPTGYSWQHNLKKDYSRSLLPSPSRHIFSSRGA